MTSMELVVEFLRVRLRLGDKEAEDVAHGLMHTLYKHGFYMTTKKYKDSERAKRT